MQLFMKLFHKAIKTIPMFGLLPTTAPCTLFEIFALNSASTSVSA